MTGMIAMTTPRAKNLHRILLHIRSLSTTTAAAVATSAGLILVAHIYWSSIAYPHGNLISLGFAVAVDV